MSAAQAENGFVDRAICVVAPLATTQSAEIIDQRLGKIVRLSHRVNKTEQKRG
jgi:hypothetical protein